MVGEKTLELLKQILTDSSYTVAICGPGIVEEGDILGLKQEGRVYEIEQRYSRLPEELFHIPCLSRKPGRFYEPYRGEILEEIPSMTPSVKMLARVEEEGKLQCIVTTNISDLPEQVGCWNVIYLHGSIYRNRYLRYSRLYPMEEIRDSSHVPHCKDCGTMIRPSTSLCGEMMDSGIMSRTTEEIVRVNVFLVLGTDLRSEVYSSYIRHFQGGKMVIIHRVSRPSDKKASMVIYDLPQNVLPLLVDGEIQEGRDRIPLFERGRFRPLHVPACLFPAVGIQ